MIEINDTSISCEFSEFKVPNKIPLKAELRLKEEEEGIDVTLFNSTCHECFTGICKDKKNICRFNDQCFVENDFHPIDNCVLCTSNYDWMDISSKIFIFFF